MRLEPLPLSAFEKIAIGIARPEDVVVAADGRVFATTVEAAAAEILPDGSFRLLGRKGGAPNGLTIDALGRLLIANFGVWSGEPGGLERLDPATGLQEMVIAEVDGRRLTASNYPVVDSQQNIWVSHSTSATKWTEALDGRDDGFIYVVRPDGSASIVAEGLQFANGLALSADERFLYCAQTVGADVLRFPILPGARLAAGERFGPKLGIVADGNQDPRQVITPELRSLLGYTDGIGFDAAGNLWVTLPAANKIVAIQPDGQVLTLVSDPRGELLREPTNIAWGGPELMDLYVGSIGVDYVLKARSPVPGQPQSHQRR